MMIIGLLIIVLLTYLGLIFKFNYGWDNLKIYEENHITSVSIVIAARNEESNICNLIDDLKGQIYPSNLIEIIVVDDHSNDNTFELLKKETFIKVLKSDAHGKKMALNTGVKASNNEIILTTDADCRLPKEWVQKMMAPFVSPSVSLVSGPVDLANPKNWFEKWQRLEFLSLIASAAGAIGINRPFMCNGANMAFRKVDFFDLKSNIASGDDVFLLHHVKQLRREISFVKDPMAIVTTSAKQHLSSFINQRKRWAAKSSSYSDKTARYISILIFMTNLILCIGLFLNYKVTLILFILLKLLPDFIFMKKIVCFFNYKNWVYSFLISQLIYPIYIIFIAVSAQLGTFNWKGRTYNE